MSDYAVSERRAELIGRTEIIRASNAGSLAGAQETNIPMRKFWLSTRDDRTRGANPKDIFDHFSVNEDKGYPLDEAFRISGELLMHPGDRSNGASPGNTINCRCTLTYQVIEEDEQVFIEETVEPTTFDFSGKKKTERKWHEEYGWDMDKQLGNIAVKTAPLDGILNSGKKAYYKDFFNYNSRKTQKKIQMNGYRLGSARAKRTWHHEYGHAIDFQLSHITKNDDIWRGIGPNRYNLNKNDFAFSNLALREVAELLWKVDLINHSLKAGYTRGIGVVHNLVVKYSGINCGKPFLNLLNLV